MAEYKFRCYSQQELVKAISLLTERNATLGFELEAVVSGDFRKLKEAVELAPHFVEGGLELEEAKDFTKKALSNLALVSLRERVMPFSSYDLLSSIDRPQLRHKVPDFLGKLDWESENGFVRELLDEMTGVHRLLLGHRVYNIRAENIRRGDALKIWKAMIKALVPQKMQVRKLSLQLEPEEIKGEYANWTRYGASMFYSANGEVSFFTSYDGDDCIQDLQKFFDLNQLRFEFQKPGNSRFRRN